MSTHSHLWELAPIACKSSDFRILGCGSEDFDPVSRRIESYLMRSGCLQNAQSAQQRKLVDVTKSISNTKTHSKNAPVTTAKPALHECRSVTATEARRHNLASGDSAEKRRMKAKVTEKCDGMVLWCLHKIAVCA